MQTPGIRPAAGAPRRPRDRSAALHALAWSVSRHRLLAGCERAVFWQYFGSRGLGLATGDPTARRAFALKALTALPLLVGTAVHTAAQTLVTAILDGAPRPSYDALLVGARFTLNQVWRASQPDQIDRFWQMPGAYTALQEVVYRGRLRPDEIGRTRARLASCLANLCEAPFLKDVARAGRDGVRVGFAPPELFAVPGGEGDGAGPRLVAWAAHDLLYLQPGLGALPAWRRGRVAETLPEAAQVASPTWCIVDLKTGKADEGAERLQLGAYGLWLEATGVAPTDGVYLGRIVDLLTPADRWYRIGAEERAAARAVIAADVARQQALMLDPAQGVPEPRDEWSLAADRRLCPRCRFYALCRDELRPLHERVADLRRGRGSAAKDEEGDPRDADTRAAGPQGADPRSGGTQHDAEPIADAGLEAGP